MIVKMKREKKRNSKRNKEDLGKEMKDEKR
jgi:hypothetical protein